jgi:hypothetical protein
MLNLLLVSNGWDYLESPPTSTTALKCSQARRNPKAGGPASNPSEGGVRTCCMGKRSRTKTAGGAVGIRRRMVFGLVAALRKRFEQRALNQHLTTPITSSVII